MRNKKTKNFMLFALTLVIGCFFLLPAQAKAATKTNTYKYDAKSGVLYESAVRVSYNVPITYSADVYLPNEGDRVSTIKTSKGLVAKVTYSYELSGDNNYTTCSDYDGDLDYDKRLRFKSRQEISFFAAKPGTYTAKFTVKNAKGKKLCTKSIKVYAGNTTPYAYISYAGVKNYGNNILTKKASGKFKLKANSDYKIKKLEIATSYDTDGNLVYKTFKNGKKITLAKENKYKQSNYKYESGDPNDPKSYYYKNETYETFDYLKPVTYIKITYYDKKLKTTEEDIVHIINIK